MRRGRGANAPRPSTHPRRIVIPAKAGTYCIGGNLAPQDDAQAPDPPLPIRGEDAANAAREGTAVGARSVPSFLRRQESIRRHSAADGAQPRLHGTHGASSFPRKREPTGSRPVRESGNPAPHNGAQAPNSPSPYKGRGRRERGGRGYCGRGANARRPSTHPRRIVIPAKAGTYWKPPCPRKREPCPITARKRRIPPLPTRGEDAANAAGEGTAVGARTRADPLHIPGASSLPRNRELPRRRPARADENPAPRRARYCVTPAASAMIVNRVSACPDPPTPQAALFLLKGGCLIGSSGSPRTAGTARL